MFAPVVPFVTWSTVEFTVWYIHYNSNINQFLRYLLLPLIWASQVAQLVKNVSTNAGDMGSFLGPGRHPGGGNGNLLQYSLLEIPRTEEPGELSGARVRQSARGKGHEEGGLTYAKTGSSLRSPPGNPCASTPITRACLLYYFVLPPTPLTLWGAVPHHLFRRRS